MAVTRDGPVRNEENACWTGSAMRLYKGLAGESCWPLGATDHCALQKQSLLALEEFGAGEAMAGVCRETRARTRKPAVPSYNVILVPSTDKASQPVGRQKKHI